MHGATIKIIVFIRYIYVKGTTILNVGTILAYIKNCYAFDVDISNKYYTISTTVWMI